MRGASRALIARRLPSISRRDGSARQIQTSSASAGYSVRGASGIVGPRTASFDSIEEPVVLNGTSTAGLVEPVLPPAADHLHDGAEERASDHRHQDQVAVNVGPLPRVENIEVLHGCPQAHPV